MSTTTHNTHTNGRTMLDKAAQLIRPIYGFLDFLAPISDLLVRLWVANVFFKSGLTKIESWDSTVLLFTHEYQVPLLSPTMAAYMGTFVELTFPVLLALGLAGRFAAGFLFVFNIMAVISYPTLNAAGIQDHQLWGVMLLVTLLHGPGKLSVDYLISRFVNR